MIYLIAAMTKKGVIGKKNALPWNISEELKHFRTTTQGGVVIMGLRTYQSIGRPLPNRNNIVLAPAQTLIPGVDVCQSTQEALAVAQSYNKDIFVIGGAYTYAQFLPYTDVMYISYITHDYDGDVYFPSIDWSIWQETSKALHAEFEVVTYERKK